MLPYDNKSEFQIVVDLPEGTSLERTDATVRDFEHYLATVPEVTNYQSYVGASSPIDFNGLVRHYNLRQGPNLADIRINLLPKHEARPAEPRPDALAAQRPGGPRPASRRAHQARRAAARSARARDPRRRGARVRTRCPGRTSSRRDATSSGGSPAWTPSSTPTSWWRSESTRFDFVLDKEKAALHGVATADVVRTLRLALEGDQPATVHEPGERQALRLRLVLSRAERSGPEELARLQVKGRTGVLVPLAEIGRFEERADDLTIMHKDLERTVFVLGDVTGRPPADVVFAIEDDVAETPLPGEARGRVGRRRASGRSRSTCSATSGSPSSAP